MSEQPVVHGEPILFVLADAKFRLNALDPVSSLNGLALLQRSVLPLFGQLAAMVDFSGPKPKPKDEVSDADVQGLLVQAVTASELLPHFYALFEKRCEVLVMGKFQSLATFPECFARRGTLLISWLIKCLTYEYSDFLSETGLNLLVETAKESASLLGFVGKSGSSQATPG
jgi:hypothetical protein